MSADLSAYTDALKEVWTQDTLETQFYEGNPFLDQIEKTSSHTIGEKAIVPLKVSRNGGFSAVPSSGSSALNAAGNVGIDAAEYQLKYFYQQVKLEHAAMIQTAGKAAAVANVIDTEMEGATSSIRKQITRQLFGNGDALIAQCTTTSGSTEVELLSTGYGYDAIVRRWLHPGLTVDIGTTGSEATILGDTVITAVEKSASTPSITVGTAITTSSSHYVSIANARAGTTSYEMNGLLNLVSETSTVGGIGASGEWIAAEVDSSTTALTLPAILALQERVLQETGEMPTQVLTSFKQQRILYDLLQNQVRFSSDSVAAGGVNSVTWNGLKVTAQVDCPDRQFWMLSPKDFLIVKGAKGAHWLSEYEGKGQLTQIQNTTAFGGTLAYPIQLGVKRRNGSAGFTGLTA